jgi:hypothetical protein
MEIAHSPSIFDVITDFLASEPSPKSILEFRLPLEVEAHALELIERKRDSGLSFDEETELMDFIRADDMMTLLKAKTRLKHPNLCLL